MDSTLLNSIARGYVYQIISFVTISNPNKNTTPLKKSCVDIITKLKILKYLKMALFILNLKILL